MEDEDFEVDDGISNEESTDIEVSDEVEENEEIEPMMDFINSVQNDQLRDAGNIFKSATGDRVRDALESERINIGSNMFASTTDEE